MNDRRRLILVTAAVLAAIAFLLALFYLGHLNGKMSDAIVSAPWRNPVEIDGRDGQPVVRVYGDDWRVSEPVRLRDLPPHVTRAFLAAEDVRFYQHAGIDPIGILRALVTNVRGGRIAQGGSTITQQLVKGKLFTNARTFRRKVPEMLLAVLLTARMSKDDVLEGYLNEVYLGQSGGAPVLGLDEAARMYFDKAPGALTVEQAAMIAGLVRAPNRSPQDHRAAVRERRDEVLQTMHEQKWLTDAEYERAVSRPVELSPGTLPDTPYGHYLSALRTELAGLNVATPPGSRIVTELDPAMQTAAESVARRGVASVQRSHAWLRRRNDLQTALLSVDPRDGGVRALVGSRDFRLDAYDRTRRMHRQPGSAIKPFVYAAAIASKKFTAASVLLDEPLSVRLDRRRVWQPHDYDGRFRGPVSLRAALEQSLNVPTVRLAQSVGSDAVIHQLHAAGFDEEFDATPSLPLGVTDVTLRELVEAYTAFPNRGSSMPLHLVREVRDQKGRLLFHFDAKPAKVFDPAVAWIVHDLMRGVVLRGTASRLSDSGLDFVAGKTGTTSDYRDAWFVGYSPDLLTGLWVGCDDGTPLRLSAGEVAVPLWSDYASRVKMSRLPIAPPAGVVFADIDPSSGALYERGCDGPFVEPFIQGTVPRTTCHGDTIRLASERGNPEPPEITDAQSQQWSAEAQGEEPDSPDEIVAGGAGRVPQVANGEGDDEEKSVKPKKHGKRHHHHHKHRRGHGGNSIEGVLRRIFG